LWIEPWQERRKGPRAARSSASSRSS
jgi:hypothetical protein